MTIILFNKKNFKIFLIITFYIKLKFSWKKEKVNNKSMENKKIKNDKNDWKIVNQSLKTKKNQTQDTMYLKYNALQ